MDKWHDMGVVTGGAAAALAGLLFVAVTLRIDTIAAAGDLRSRAAQTLTLFVTSLVVAIVDNGHHQARDEERERLGGAATEISGGCDGVDSQGDRYEQEARQRCGRASRHDAHVVPLVHAPSSHVT